MAACKSQTEFTVFARYHISDLRAVMDSIIASGKGDHFLIENPGKREDGSVAENSFTIYTDLIASNATELVKQYQNFGLRSQLGLVISIKA